MKPSSKLRPQPVFARRANRSAGPVRISSPIRARAAAFNRHRSIRVRTWLAVARTCCEQAEDQGQEAATLGHELLQGALLREPFRWGPRGVQTRAQSSESCAVLRPRAAFEFMQSRHTLRRRWVLNRGGAGHVSGIAHRFGNSAGYKTCSRLCLGRRQSLCRK